MKDQIINLCIYCKNNVVIFPVEPVNQNFVTCKCGCCGKKVPCQTYKMIPKGETK